MLYTNALVYVNHGFEEADLLTEGTVIRAVGKDLAGRYPGIKQSETKDLKGKKIVPGFIDIHTHGGKGVDVNAASAEDLEDLACFFASRGTTSFLCSVLTDTEEATDAAIDAFLKWRQMPHKGARIIGLHLEGPFLSPDYKGAMPEHLLRAPDIDLVRSYQTRAQGAIRYLTIAPELPGAIDMIPALRELDIEVALGHSGADYDTMYAAVRNGARAVTHTGNGMRMLHQHEPGVFGSALTLDRLYCEMICDGRHLHPAVVRLLFQAKGAGRLIAITDSIMAAGMEDGRYKLGVNDIIVKDGDARLADKDTRAGSTLTTGQALKNILSFTGKSLQEVLPVLTENPAAMLGLDDRYGTLMPGLAADFCVLDEGNNVIETVVDGVSCATAG